MPFLFQPGVEQGSNAINLQWATYSAVWDFAPAIGWNIELDSGAHVNGEDLLDFSNPELAVADEGVYFITANFSWDGVESGASVFGELIAYQGLGVTQSSNFTADLGVTHPNPALSPAMCISGIAIATDPAQSLFYMQISHNRATDNLRGVVYFSLARLF